MLNHHSEGYKGDAATFGYHDEKVGRKGLFMKGKGYIWDAVKIVKVCIIRRTKYGLLFNAINGVFENLHTQSS